MSKIGKDVLIDLLHTNAGKEVARKSISHDTVIKFGRTVSDYMISAEKYYTGKPDGKFFTSAEFGDDVVNAKKAYITINTLMGGETAELNRFNEGKKQVPGLITPLGLTKIVDMVVLLFAFANTGEAITYETVRACRQSEISETEDGKFVIVDALASTTKLSIEEIMNLGYGDKNHLAICRYHFHSGAVALDMEKFGSDYLKPEEKEVLLLTGNKLQAKCLGYEDRYRGKDGEAALMYDVDVYEPDAFYWNLDEGDDNETLRAKVLDNDTVEKVRSFYEALNAGGDFPEMPDGYKEWKHNFQKLIFSELNKIF